MSRRKSGAERRAIRNRNKRARSGGVVGEDVPGLPPVGDDRSKVVNAAPVGQASIHQVDAPNELQQPDQLSPWWRELSPENIAKANAMGMGGAAKTMMDRRLELRAVAENWPISRDVRERIVYESLMVLLDPNADPRLKQRERWMLHKMSEANRVPNLPAQVTLNSTVNNTVNAVTIRQVLDAMNEGDQMGILDMRDNKILPGSVDDYAE